MLGTPRSLPASVPLWLTVGHRPHWSAWPRGGAPPTSGSRRRWGLRPQGENQRAPRSEAHPRVPLAWPEDGRSTLAGVHGGTTALLAVATPLRRGRAPAKPQRSLLKTPQTRCARKQAKRGETGQVLARRGTPTRSVNSGEPLWPHGGLPPQLSARRGLPRLWRTRWSS